MRVLVACEFSGVVRDAFAKRGHEAWSCDLLPSDRPGNHIQGDVIPVLSQGWDLMIAHPPCTHLAVSGAAHFEAKRKDGRQMEAVKFFLMLANAPIPKICVENPVCIMSSYWRKPEQVIHPWQFGHTEQKTTCLWLKNLPALEHIDEDDLFSKKTHVYEEMMRLPKKERERLHYLSPSPTRSHERSKTFQGIADAMAAQWG